MISTPTTTFLSDTYLFHYEVESVKFLLERFTEGHDGLHVEVTVTTEREPAPGLLHFGRLNLSASVGKGQVAKALKQRAAPGFLDDVDFTAMVEQVCYRALARYRQGEPFINLRDVQFLTRRRWLLAPYIEYSGATVIFARGGTGKSMFGLTIAASIATGISLVGGTVDQQLPTLYGDWEADEFTHAERLAAICEGAGVEIPDLFYQRGIASLAETGPALRREVARHNIGFIVIDSMGAARGGDPNSAELTIKLFGVIRSLGIPALLIDHVAKNGDNAKDNPFGSVFTTNGARSTWYMESVQTEGSDEASVQLANVKVNNGRKAKRQGFRNIYHTEEMDGDERLISVRWIPANVRDLPEFLGSLGQRDQVIAALQARNTSMHPDEIAELLQGEWGIEITSATVRAVLSAGSTDKPRYKAAFVPDATARGKWGLISWRTP